MSLHVIGVRLKHLAVLPRLRVENLLLMYGAGHLLLKNTTLEMRKNCRYGVVGWEVQGLRMDRRPQRCWEDHTYERDRGAPDCWHATRSEVRACGRLQAGRDEQELSQCLSGYTRCFNEVTCFSHVTLLPRPWSIASRWPRTAVGSV